MPTSVTPASDAAAQEPDYPEAPEASVTLTAEQAETLIINTIQRDAESLLRTAQRHSLCADDAQEAYQRAMEIFLRRAATLDPPRAGAWLHTVTKHEAMAVRDQRQQLVASVEIDFDREEARHLPSPDEHIVSFDQLTRSAEALQRLKPNELRALWMKASGQSYNAIAEAQGWTYTNSRGHRVRLIRRVVHLRSGRGTVTFHTTRAARRLTLRATYAGSPAWLAGSARRTVVLRSARHR